MRKSNPPPFKTKGGYQKEVIVNDYTSSTTASVALPMQAFIEWRDENILSALEAPYHLYRRIGRRKENRLYVPVAVQHSLMLSDVRRHFAVIYREVGGKSLLTVVVCSKAEAADFHPINWTAGE